MNLANCTRCGKLFSQQFHPFCQPCMKGIENDYVACSAYLQENKNSTMQELSEGTGVSTRQIIQFIREGRLTKSHAPNISCPCESCGEPILEGHICESCRVKLKREIHNAQARPGAPASEPTRTNSGYKIGNRSKDRF